MTAPAPKELDVVPILRKVRFLDLVVFCDVSIQVLTSVCWMLIFALMEFVRTYMAAIVATVTVAMSLILLEGIVLVNCLNFIIVEKFITVFVRI